MVGLRVNLYTYDEIKIFEKVKLEVIVSIPDASDFGFLVEVDL